MVSVAVRPRGGSDVVREIEHPSRLDQMWVGERTPVRESFPFVDTDPFNATLFRIGVLSYAGYVVLFPGAFGLVAAELDLRSARRGFEERSASFKEVLLPEKVSTIVGDKVLTAQTSFHRWLLVIALCYVAIVIAAIVAAIFVPPALTPD